MRAVQAQTIDALTVNVGERAAYFAPPPADGGLLRAELLALLLQGGVYVSAAESDRPHLFVEATKRAFADHASWLQAAGGDGAPAGGAALSRASAVADAGLQSGRGLGGRRARRPPLQAKAKTPDLPASSSPIATGSPSPAR